MHFKYTIFLCFICFVIGIFIGKDFSTFPPPSPNKYAVKQQNMGTDDHSIAFTKVLPKRNDTKNLLELDESNTKTTSRSPTKLSQIEVNSVLEEPFFSAVSMRTGQIARFFRELHESTYSSYDDDNLADNIRLFITTHELSLNISLESVTCREPICEIKGFELSSGTWSKILNEMTLQDWWKLQATASLGGENKDYGEFFYFIGSQKIDEYQH